MITFMELLDRAEEGPPMEEKDWDIRYLPRLFREKAKEHDIKFNAEIVVPSDKNLAKSVYQAGFEVAVEAGVFCASTGRIIKFDESELNAVLRSMPSEISLGTGRDTVRAKIRTLEDTQRPLIDAGPIGVGLSEEIFIPVVQSYIQERATDTYNGGTLSVIQGRQIRTGTPTEIFGAIRDLTMIREAARRAGRPGIANLGVETSPSGLGYIAAAHPEFGFYATDVHLIPLLSELKTSYNMLNMAALAEVKNAIVCGYSHPIIGGYVGGPAEVAVAIVAANILTFAVHRSKIPGHFANDQRYSANSSLEAIWAETIAHEALTLGHSGMHWGGVSPVAGPCTTMLLQEVIATGIPATVRGDTLVGGVRSAAGVKDHYCTGLEARFLGELCRAVVKARLSLDDANQLVLLYAKKYLDRLKTPDLGKPFEECYDQRRLQPTKEWLSIYEAMKKELLDHGLDCDGY